MNPHGATLNHLMSSNSTTQHFLGATQRGWMIGPGGSNASLDSSPPARPVVPTPAGDPAPDVRLQDATNAPPAIPHPPAHSPNGMRTAQVGHVQAPNARWAMVNTPQPVSTMKRSFDAAFEQSATPMTRPLEQRRQAAPVRPTIIATPMPSSFSHEITMETLPRLNAFVDQIRLTGRLNDMGSWRVAILREACVYNDSFYLCFHQLFCRAAADPLFTMRIGFGDEQLRGLDMLQTIICSNSGLPLDLLNFFANLPYPDPNDTTPIPGIIVASIGAFLSSLDIEWQDLRNTCLTRGYPPFTDELWVRLRLSSPILQKVLFNSIHRQLTRSDSTELVEQGLQIFDEDQRLSQERMNVHGYPLSNEQVQTEVRNLGSRYLSLRSALQQAGAEVSSAPNVPPAGADNQVTHQPNLTAPDTGTFPYPTWPRHGGGIHVRSTDTSLPQVQQPFEQSHPQINHIQQSPMGHRYPVTEMQQLHSQIVTNMRNQVPQTQPRRRGRPPLSYHGQNSRNTASPASPINPITASDPTRNMTLEVGRHGTATALPAAANSSRKSNNLPTRYPPLLPPLGHEPIQGTNQNYRIVALHQANLRSPKYQICNVHGMPQPPQRLYQVPNGCVLSPQVLGPSCPYFSWQFNISADHLGRKAKDVLLIPDPKNVSLAEPVRQVTSGSSLYRLNCVEVPANATSLSMWEEAWATHETVWPTGIFLAINDNQLEVRRKLHHGKDLTIDLTKFVKEGLNTLTCSLLRTTGEARLGKNFAVAVEVVEIISDGRIKELPYMLKEQDAMDLITKKLRDGLHGNRGRAETDKDNGEDEEILVMDEHISIDITDPYTARVFELPVRGKTCLHRECFDLQTFLDTRKARTSERDKETVPTSPDDWKCPICKKDARPQNLVVDGFLQHVRKKLEESDQLDIKAIRVQADGTWQPVLNTTKPDRRGSTCTDDADGLARRRQSATEPRHEIGLERWMGPSQGDAASGEQGQRKCEPVVIEID